MSAKYIVIEGNIGSGKTELTKLLSSKYQTTAIFEQFSDNPFLPKFYQNPDKYALQLEMSFLISRYKQLIKELQTNLFSNKIFADYYIKKSLIFAAETLTEDDFKLYRRMFNEIALQLPKPDLYIYLNRPEYELLKNISKRGRLYENNITEEYLHKIKTSYFRFFNQVNQFPIVIINCKGVDFVNNNESFKQISNQLNISNYKTGINYINM